MSDDPRRPPTSPIIEALLDEQTGNTKDVMALVGHVGPGRGDDVRLYSDRDGQRWMDIPLDQVAHHVPLEDVEPGPVEPGQSVVWVQREWMNGPVFLEVALTDFEEFFAGSWMSTWQMIPDTRMVAAEMLDLLPRLTDRDTY